MFKRLMIKKIIAYSFVIFFATGIPGLRSCDPFHDDGLLACDYIPSHYEREQREKAEFGYYEDEPEQTDIGTENNIIEIFHIGNLEQVYNGGTPPTFILDKSHHVTELWTYHWNDGRGAPAGTLELKTNDGQSFGPWQARLDNNVYWVADINQAIPPGEYTVIDSDPSTLSQNASTGGQGMAWMFGYPAE